MTESPNAMMKLNHTTLKELKEEANKALFLL